MTRRSAAQDDAAGGPEFRSVSVPGGGVAIASVELKDFSSTGTVFAYLRWSQGGRTINKYLGRVDGEGRAAQLRDGFRLARAKALLRGGELD